MVKYFLYKLGQFIIQRLSVDAAYKLGIFLSDLQYMWSPRDRRAVYNNLAKIIPGDPDLHQKTREVFRNFGKYLVEFFLMERMIKEDLVRTLVKVRNAERLQKVLDKGKGGIIITAHIGNWELGAVMLSRLGFSIIAVALPHKERPVNDLFNHQREIHGITVIPTSVAIRKCLGQLKENKFIALVADRDFGAHGYVMDFLGHKTRIPKGAAIFAEKTGAPVIPIFLIREADNTFTLSVEEPIDPAAVPRGAGEKEYAQKIIQQYLPVVEEKICQHPTQWMMFREFSAA